MRIYSDQKKTSIAIILAASLLLASGGASAAARIIFVSDAFQGEMNREYDYNTGQWRYEWEITEQSIQESTKIANYVANQIEVSEQVYGMSVDVLTTELNNASGSIEEYENVIEPVWGPLMSHVHGVPGNHDYFTDGAEGYKDFFGVAQTYNSFTVNSDGMNWNIIGIDSNTDEFTQAEWDAQMSWLTTEVKKEVCTLAYFHQPRWSNGEHGNNDNTRMQQLWNILASNGVEMALSGHDHNFEIFHSMDADGVPGEGTIQVVSGTGGADLRNISGSQPNSIHQVTDKYGVIDIALYGGAYTIVMNGPDNGGAFASLYFCHY